MSEQKEKETQLEATKSELDHIFDFLDQNGFKKCDESTYELETRGPSTQIVVNGQAMVKPGDKKVIRINYVGEGSLSHGDKSIAIWGFEIDVNGTPISPTEYVDSLEQFKMMLG